jgi:hypothetical protein
MYIQLSLTPSRYIFFLNSIQAQIAQENEAPLNSQINKQTNKQTKQLCSVEL